MSLVIVLNGASSSGKSTLARVIQSHSSAPLLNLSIDSTILYGLPERELGRIQAGQDLRTVSYDQLVAGYYATVRAVAGVGLSLIIDHAITAKRRAEQMVDALDGHDVVLVGLTCSLTVLEAREAARADRRKGLARAQDPTIHTWLEYDVLINSESEPAENVTTILHVVTSGKRGGFERTRRRLVAAG